MGKGTGAESPGMRGVGPGPSLLGIRDRERGGGTGSNLEGGGGGCSGNHLSTTPPRKQDTKGKRRGSRGAAKYYGAKKAETQ